MEAQLLDEIDRMAIIYGQLEEQGSKKVFLDDYKQDYKAKLLLEVNRSPEKKKKKVQIN